MGLSETIFSSEMHPAKADCPSRVTPFPMVTVLRQLQLENEFAPMLPFDMGAESSPSHRENDSVPSLFEA